MLNYATLKFATKIKEIKQLWRNEVGQFDICVTQIKTLSFKIETTNNLHLNCVYSSQQMEIRKLNRKSMEKLYVSKEEREDYIRNMFEATLTQYESRDCRSREFIANRDPIA